jgi:UDPglucose 6-dehydrogenase
MAKIAVIGTGYVGLTTGACFAHLGHTVVCADIDPHKIELLQRGEIPIVEAGLGELVHEGIANGRLSFVLGADKAVPTSEFAFLCVPTPEGEDGQADLSYVETAAAQIANLLTPDAIVVNKSTLPVGSTRVVEKILRRADVYVVSNPEFLREGSGVFDFLNPDRVVIGSDNQEAAIRVGQLYSSIDAPLVLTDAASAEAIKYAANAFLAMKLSYVNAIAAICEGVDADIRDVMLGIGLDRRIGHEFLKPGPGWGGSCFPKDTIALLKIAERAGYEFSLLESVLQTNEKQFERTAQKILAAGKPGGTVAIWGLTFKALTDDLRDSPALRVIELLQKEGITIRAFDPTVTTEIPQNPKVQICRSELDACQGADVIAVLTEWENFRWVEPQEVGQVMKTKNVVDARNLLDRSVWRGAGFNYQGIGR